MREQELLAFIGQRLTEARFQHSRRVAETARFLARTWGLDEDKCYQAGLLHDIARDLSPEELLKQAASCGIVWDEIEGHFPVLLHGPVGAEILRRELAVTDEEILEAIRLHTTGDYPLSPTAKVIFLADYIEPGRDFSGAQKAREAARRSLDAGVAVAVGEIIAYLTGQRYAVHPKAVNLYNHYVLNGFFGAG
ncbi:MAG: bis(5'-nucleosyl)-tetraphosphatase (symmetrical) YqeK [Firmicutes bacterium]|nr:bis(5'-nucleosyl)-tetraphosphatase (symmetrical) YqeK [Bacillota bacterium]